MRVPFLNTAYDAFDHAAALREIARLIESGEPHYMTSLNVDQVVKMERSESFADAFNSADLILLDGAPLVKIANRKGLPTAEKIPGSELIYSVCSLAAQRGWTCYFLGGKEGVAERAIARLTELFQGLKIAGYFSPPLGFENDVEVIAEMVRDVSKSEPDICFVCLGEPKQTIIVNEFYREFGAGLCMSIGAAIDFAAGDVKRAPKWISQLGFEWLYRFSKEPKRLFRRYFIDSWIALRLILECWRDPDCCKPQRKRGAR